MKKYILAILAYLSISFSSLIVEASAATGDNSYDGMGRIVLEKNMVNNVNTLTQDMFYKGETSHRVPNINTIFVIQYDFVLAEDITIPENCVLKFDGGSISGIYILKGNNTKIIGNGHIFNGCQFTGYFSIKEAKAEWFGVESSNTDNSSQINYALKFLRSTTVKILSFHTGRFNVKDVVTFGADNDGYSVNRSGWDFIIEGAGQGSSLPLSSGGGAWGTTFAISDFGCFFVNMLSEASGWGRSGVIRNCSFVGEKGTERGIIINQSFPFEISNCYFYGLGAAISLTGGAYYCNIFNCRFRSNDYCIKTLTSEEEYYNNNGANNNQVHNCTFQHNNYTIYLPVGGGWHIYDCDIEPENGEMYLGSYNFMDNMRIERNKRDRCIIRIGSNNILRNVSLIHAGGHQSAKLVQIEGSHNDLEISLSGAYVNALIDKVGNNKINIFKWAPLSIDYLILPITDDITIEGVNNKLPTEQGTNLITSIGHQGGIIDAYSYYPGISVGRYTNGCQAKSSDKNANYAVAIFVPFADFTVNVESNIGFGAIDNTPVYVIKKSATLFNSLGLYGGLSTIVYCSLSYGKPCFSGYDASISAIRKMSDGTTIINLSSLKYNRCFGDKDGVYLHINSDAIFMYKGQRYTYDVANDKFSLY